MELLESHFLIKMGLSDYEKGQAGMQIFLSVIVMIFIVGLLVMVFSLMGAELRDTTYDKGSVSVVNESGAYINSTGYTLQETSNYRNPYSISIDTAYNVSNSSDVTVIPASNYTLSGSTVTNATATTYPNVNLSYSFNYEKDNTATEVMNDTTQGLSNVTDWFPLFIVISAMVVLILLTILIIVAIKGSGIMSRGGTA